MTSALPGPGELMGGPPSATFDELRIVRLVEADDNGTLIAGPLGLGEGGAGPRAVTITINKGTNLVNEGIPKTKVRKA